jgi:hypothetical protein
MAKTNNPILHMARGTVAGDIVFKRYYDKTVISKKPDMSNRVLTDKQKEWQRRMAMATAYAQFLCKTENGKLKETIRLKVPAHKSVFRALIKEHLLKYANMTLNQTGEETAKLAK